MVREFEKHNPRTGQLTEGVVKYVLTSSAIHRHGIKFLLESGIHPRFPTYYAAELLKRLRIIIVSDTLTLPFSQDIHVERLLQQIL